MLSQSWTHKSPAFDPCIDFLSFQHSGLSCYSKMNYTGTSFCPQLILHTSEWPRWPTNCLRATERYHSCSRQIGLWQLWMNQQSTMPLYYQWVLCFIFHALCAERYCICMCIGHHPIWVEPLFLQKEIFCKFFPLIFVTLRITILLQITHIFQLA